MFIQDDFYSLNRKMFAVFFKNLLLFSCILMLTILFIISAVNTEFPDFSLLIIALTFAIGLAVVLFIVSAIRGLWDLKKRKNIFNDLPFSDLKNHGFELTFLFKNNKWKFAEPVIKGIVDGVTFIGRVDTQYAPNTLHFSTFINEQTFNKSTFIRLRKELPKYNAAFDFDGIMIKMPLKHYKDHQVTKVLLDLKKLAGSLNKEGLNI